MAMMNDGSSVAGTTWYSGTTATSNVILYGQPVFKLDEDRLLTPLEWLRQRVDEITRLAAVA